jgi:hypothetical protein
MGAPETSNQVKRSLDRVSPKFTHLPVRGHETEAGLGLNPMIDADRPRKVLEVGAATHADVLAGVDELAGRGISEGAGSAAQAVARFEDRHLKSSGRQGRRRRQPG